MTGVSPPPGPTTSCSHHAGYEALVRAYEDGTV